MSRRVCLSLAAVVLCVGVAAAPAVGQQGPPADTVAEVDTAEVVSAPDSDESELESRIRATFGEIEAFEGISLRVRHGVLHLEGTVVDPQQAEEAERLAREFEGVRFVENEVTAETNLADRVTPVVSRLQEYGQSLVEYLPVGLVALLIILLTLGVARWIGRLETGRRLRLSPIAWSLLQRSVQVVLVLMGLVVTFDLLGVTSLVGAVLGTAGVAGLAIGFAFKDIIENYLAGVLLSIRQPFRVNDVVSINGYEGRVVRMTARELVLLTSEGNHVRMPNASVFKNVLVNYTLNPRRLVVFEIGIGTKEDLPRAQRLGVETLAVMTGILDEPPPFARVLTVGDSSVTVRYHGWVDQTATDFLKVQSEAVRLVKTALDDAGVELPEPTYRLIQMPPHGTEAEAEDLETPPEHVREQARLVDVSPDGRMEAQVDEEAHRSDEPNLLDDQRDVESGDTDFE